MVFSSAVWWSDLRAGCNKIFYASSSYQQDLNKALFSLRKRKQIVANTPCRSGVCVNFGTRRLDFQEPEDLSQDKCARSICLFWKLGNNNFEDIWTFYWFVYLWIEPYIGCHHYHLVMSEQIRIKSFDTKQT